MLENFNTVDNNLGTVENIDVENNQTPDTGGIPAPTTDSDGGGTPQKTNTVPPPVTSSSFLDAQQFFENKLSKSESFRRPELFKEYRTIPGENTEGRFLDAKFGFSPILDNEDFYAQRQSGINKLGIGLLKLPTLVATKVGSSVGFLGSLLNPVNWFDENGYFSAVADNSISGFFDTWENSIKNNWLPTFQEAEDRDQGFFKSLGDANFWAEDFVDGAAFMASAWIPGMALSKLGLGAKAISTLAKFGTVGAETLGVSIEGAESVANYFQNAAKYAKTIDKFNAWALATSSESMFEAKGVKDTLTESLKDSNYTEEEKKKIIGSNTKDTFLMNAVLLGATNLFELPLVNKILGKADGAIGNIAPMTRFGEEAAVKEASSKLGKILSNKYATIAKDVISGTFREGFVEENGQLAIQKYHEELGAAGKIADVLDLNNYANVAKKTYQQTRDVFGLGDKPNIEAEKSIGLGAILGGGQTAIANRIQSKRDKLTTEQAITMYNQAQQSWLKFGNPYLTETIVSKDENGEEVKKEKILFDSNNKPVIDQKKLDSIISSLAMNSGIMVASDKQENLSIRNLLRDNAFADFVIAHIQIGQEDKLKTKLDALSTATPEELAKFGFAPDETSADQINRYRSLADTIIKQNKIINNDILYDGTPEDQARKIKLTELAAQQAVYRNLRVDENRMLNEVKNQILTPENSSLSDGIVDQLNMLKLRIQDMDKYIDDLKTNKTNRKTSLAVAEKNRKELQEEYDNLLKTNELSVKNLKQDSKGFYQYEKNERNDPTLLTPLVKRMYYLGSLENTVKKLGKEWASFADFKNGKKNFLANFDETITQVINNKIETDNSDRDITDIDEEPQQGSENFEDLVDTSEFDVEPQDFDFLGNAIPKLDDYLKNLYDLEKSKNNISKPFEEWKTSEDANPYIKVYNDKYDKKESLNTKKDTTEPPELPEDFEYDEEGGNELPDDFFGTTFLDSIKLGPYVIHKGDLIDDKLVELITDSNIIIAGEPYLHNEVLQMIDIFKGRNIKSKVAPPPAPTNQNDPDEFENGEIQNVQDTRNSVINTILQKIIDAFDQSRGIIFGGSDKVVSGIKVNNRSDEYKVELIGSNRIDKVRTTASPNYPLVLGTKAINIGTKLIISANYDIDDFEEENLLDPTDTKTRKRSNFFTVDNKVHDNVKDEFPIKIETIVNGEKVLLGHLPTMSWLTARYPDGNTVNVVEFTKGPSGEQINNLENQIRFVKDLRETIFKGHNSNTKFELYANVNRKSLGKLRLDESEGGKRNLNKLSQVLHPKTKLGIIKGGKIRVGTNETLDPDNFIGNKNLKNIEGFPVFFIDTPTEKQLFSFASVPKLAEQHTNLIIEGWIAFHELNNKTETRKTGAELEKYKNVVKAIYAAYGNEYDEKFNIDFNILKNYINDYVTFTSNKKDYNPLLKEGTGQMNITPKGELVVWVVKDKTKPKDILYIESLKEFRFGDKSKQLQEKLKSLYYTVKASSDTANGINSNVKMQFLSYDNNKKEVVKSKPMTYNEYIMNILETNIEKGRPVDSSNPDSPYVHFANPVVNFSYTSNDNNLKDLEQKTTTTTPTPASTAPVSTDTKADRTTTANNAVIAADYLFTGGKDVMLSTDYLLQALIGSFPPAGKAIDSVRIKYGPRIGNIRDDIGSNNYQTMMEEIRQIIKSTYNDPRVEEIFNKILANATGFTFREGNLVSSELEKLNEEYDANLTSLKQTQPTVSTDNKGDVEKRREEELNDIAEKINNQVLDEQNPKGHKDFSFTKLNPSEKIFLLKKLVSFNNKKIDVIIKKGIYNLIKGEGNFSSALQYAGFDTESREFNDIMFSLQSSLGLGPSRGMNTQNFIGKKSEYLQSDIFKDGLKILSVLKQLNYNVDNILTKVGNEYDTQLADLEVGIPSDIKTNIENKRKEEIKQKAPYVLIQGFYEGDNNTIATLTFKSNIDNTYAYAEKQINISTDALRNDPALSNITKEQYNAAILAPKIIDEIDRKYDIEIAKELYKELKAGKKLRDMSMSEMKIVTKYLTPEFKAKLDAQEAGTKKSNVQNDLIVTKDVLEDLSLLLKDYMNIEDESDRLKTVKGFVNSFGNSNLNKLGINDDLITNFLTGKFRYIAEVKDIIDSQINKAPLDKPINLVQITDLKQMYNTGFKERPDHKDWYVEHHLKVVEAIVDDLSSKYGGDPNMLKLMVYTHDLAKALNNETKTHYQTIEPILKNMGFSNQLIKELSKNLELMDKVKTEKIDNLPIEVKIVSTADALSHYTTGKNGFLNIFSTITSKEDMSKIADSNKAKIQKDQNKILLPGFDLSNVKLDYNGRVTYVQGDIPSYVNSVMGISEEQTKTDTSTDLLDLDINFGESASSIGDIDDGEPPFSIRTNNLKDVKKICK